MAKKKEEPKYPPPLIQIRLLVNDYVGRIVMADEVIRPKDSIPLGTMPGSWMQYFNMIDEAERRFKVKMKDEELDGIRTTNDLHQLIASKFATSGT